METTQAKQAITTEEEEFDFSEKYELVKKIGRRLIYAHTTYYEIEEPDYEQFVTEDNTPVDNIFSEKEQRLLIDPLHANEWTDRNFLASSNVAIYYSSEKPPIVPDMFLSFDVVAPTEWFEKKNRCYFVWVFEKVPEMVVEVVSNKVGGEDEGKMEIYAKMGVLYYILIDPYHYLFDKSLNIFRLEGKTYQPFDAENLYMPEINLGIKIWQGLFEKHEAPWARWCSKEGDILKTGAERTFELSAENSKLAEQLAKERLEKEQEQQKIEKLKAQLEALGLKPNA
jgi:Uma2 family endonuclease